MTPPPDLPPEAASRGRPFGPISGDGVTAGLYEQIQESVALIRRRITMTPSPDLPPEAASRGRPFGPISGDGVTPQIAVVLGTGLGRVAEHLVDAQRVSYAEIPHFPVSTVESHTGELVIGRLGAKIVAAMEGRFHRYEGYSMQQVTYPIRVLRALGTKILIVSNACGGMNPAYQAGDLMLIADHINLMGENPLVGPNDERLGIRFPDMSGPYDGELLALAVKIAREEQITAHQGVYVGVLGPNLETRAEYTFLRLIGADVVGMSTVPEVIVGVHAGFRILGISCVTDRCIPETLKPTTVEEVIRVAMAAEPKITRLVTRVIERVTV